MPIRTNNKLRKTAVRDDELYERFAKKIEKEHKGEYIAINKNGEFMISQDDIELLQQAIQKFGRGNFAFRKIGFKTLGKWRSFGVSF
jgi:predicted small metal-binding protein